MGNFKFLQIKKNFEEFSNVCVEAEKTLGISSATSAIISRRALELAVKWVYANDADLDVPYQDNISSLIHNQSFKDLIDDRLFYLLKYIIKLGNIAVHTNTKITRDEAILSLQNLHQFISWIDYCYADEYTAGEFDEKLLDEESEIDKERKAREKEIKSLYEQLSAKDKKLEEVIKEKKKERISGKEKREENTQSYDFEVNEITEFKTRKIYIDIELKLAGWDFDKNIVEELEVEGMPSESGKGKVDYVLFGENGKPLAVVEAKRTSKDPRIGKQQAKLYADCLEKKYNQRPCIFYTNGFDYYIWDDYSERSIYGFYKQSELQLMMDRRIIRKPLQNIHIKDEISNRYYQKEAIVAVCEAFERKQRKALIVCATGTGKTRTAISIVDVLSRHNWVKNILFLADRKALVKQAKKNFVKLLPNTPACNLLDKKDSPDEARIVFATYPTMLNSIDDTKAKDGKKLFTTGHFDLIIIDESHRSIYKKYSSIFEYFDAYLLGLTATPRDEVDKNTYSVFDLENGVPTYSYEYREAVNDGFLVDYKSIEIKTKLMEAGVKYDDLSREDKEAYEEKFNEDDDIKDEISSSAMNKWLFNDKTIDIVLDKLMTKGLKIEGGDKLGKTIIFAQNSKHARAIAERFKVLYPELDQKGFASVVEYNITYVDNIIDDFSDKNKMPQIAISVDMLDTGIDIPEILNLVFFKKIRSKTKFWQMIGRGTRLCPDLLGIGQDKEEFLIFDFCNNFEFFRMYPKGFEGKQVESISERIFNLKVSIVRELQNLKYSSDEYQNKRTRILNELIKSIKSLNEDSYNIRMNLRYVHKYKREEAWQALGSMEQKELSDNIAYLIKLDNDDELAKRFDIIMYSIILAYLQQNNPKRAIKSVINTAEQLAKLGTIPQIKEKKDVIQKVMMSEFWESADIFVVEDVRKDLRELVKYLDEKNQKIYYTPFDDMIIAETEGAALYLTNDLKDYKKKVEYYLNEHQTKIAIYKIKNNKKLTKEDLDELEEIFLNELGTKDDYINEYKDMPMTCLVRQVLGLDRQAANEAFSKFLNNQNLNTKQIHFVKLVVDYIVKNGFIENNSVLMEDPFRSVGSIIDLFANNINERNELMYVITSIKDNLITINEV